MTEKAKEWSYNNINVIRNNINIIYVVILFIKMNIFIDKTAVYILTLVGLEV